MSYLFDGNNHRIKGSFTSTYSQPMTLALMVKLTHPSASQVMMQIGNNSASQSDGYTLRTSGTQHVFNATPFAADGTSVIATSPAVNIDGVWAGIVGVFTADTGSPLRDIYVQAFANSGTNAVAKAVSDALQHIQIGENLGGTSDFNSGLIAEVAIWNKALVQAEIESYLAFNAASGIAAANLVGYWPLSASNATQANEGLDAGGDLAVTTATFDPDHPTISSGSSVAPLAQYFNSLRDI